MSKRGRLANKKYMPVIIVWALTLLYTLFIIYISTTSLPAELPDETDDNGGGDDDNNSGGGGGGGGIQPVTPPPKGPDPMLRPIYSLRDQVPNFQVLANIGLYLIFGLLLFISLSQVRKIGLPMAFLGCVLLGVLLSLSMEFTQSFVDRVTDINDVIANGSGALMGAFAGAMIIFGYRDHVARSRTNRDADNSDTAATDEKDRREIGK